MIVDFAATLWVWDARRIDTWVFVSLPLDASDEIRDVAGDRARGFGSLRVRVRVGTSTWTTSIFPDKASGGYVLPLKGAIRKAEGVDVGDTASISVELIDL